MLIRHRTGENRDLAVGLNLDAPDLQSSFGNRLNREFDVDLLSLQLNSGAPVSTMIRHPHEEHPK